MMKRQQRSRRLAERVSYLYACALVTAHYLCLPLNGYERMMDGKYVCFLALTLGYLAAMAIVFPAERPCVTPMRACAAAYLLCSAASALLSPYGARTLLGGSRKDGIVTILLYVLVFYSFSRCLRADRRLLCLAAAAATVCAALSLLQTAGLDPLGLYPAGTNYYDGDVAYAGFYAGTSGNIDFTAFLLALFAAVAIAALVRLRVWALAPAAAVMLLALYRLGVAAAWVGLAFALLCAPALLFPRHRRALLLAAALLTALALAIVWNYGGTNRTLWEAARLLHGEADGSFGSGRLAIWRACLPLVRERPLLGGGPDTLWLRGLAPFVWMKNGVAVPADITAAHNEYLNILVNQGALALAAYLGLLGCAIFHAFRHAEQPRFALCGAGVLCYGAMALFSISTCITAPYVWLLLAILDGDENNG